MAAKKRSASGHKKRPRASEEGENSKHTTEQRKPCNERVSNGAFSQLKYGVLVLGVAIALGVLWNKFDSTDPRVRTFLSKACQKTAFCARFVIPTRRTLQAGRPIRAGEVLVEIPRSLQFWDLDALRDPFVRAHLLSARHALTNNVVARGAYLAAWLSLQMHNKESETDPVRKSYLEALPSIEELSYHPVLWTIEDLTKNLEGHSLNFAVALNYLAMVDSEYEAFAKVSSEFATQVNVADYKAARINVLTRTFSPGPVGEDEDLGEEEYEMYLNELGFDFKKGSHAMVPILDLLNHHPNPNVVYRYNKEKRAFVISAKNTIPSAWEIMDSYGQFTDSHLFAKFGFVTGDGSGHTQASIALFHRMMDFNMNREFSHVSHKGKTEDLEMFQRSDLRRYLQFDDGYIDCIQGPDVHPEEYQLKKLKMEHLIRIANDAKYWVVNVHPRAPHSSPVESSDISITDAPPELDPSKLRMDFSRLVDTCRLLSLTTDDYDGKAIEILTTNLKYKILGAKRDNEALEYRALMW
jgi:hypothetical protein